MPHLTFLSTQALIFLAFFQLGSASLSTPCSAGSKGFSYDDTASTGPSSWHNLDPDNFAACSSTLRQSPIDIPKSTITGSQNENPTLNLGSHEMKFECTDYNFELHCENVGTCGSTNYLGTAYQVVNQHFHAPSEHTWDGERFALEAHTVHANSAGNFLVIATFFRQDDDEGSNAQIQDILDKVDSAVSTNDALFDVDMASLVKADENFCTYEGSLTTPPCSEIVTWIINRQIQTVTSAQIAQFESDTGSAPFGNARPTQHPQIVTCFTQDSDDDGEDEEGDGNGGGD